MDSMTPIRASAPTPPGQSAEPPPSVSFEETATVFAAETDVQLRQAHLLFSALSHPWLARLGIPLITPLLKAGVPGVKWIIKRTVFEQFCGGESIQECQTAVEALGRHGV